MIKYKSVGIINRKRKTNCALRKTRTRERFAFRKIHGEW